METDKTLPNGDFYEEVLCPICNNAKCAELYRQTKRTGTALGDVIVTVSQCRACGFVYNSPRIRTEVMDEYYFSDLLASGQIYRDRSADGHYPKLHSQRAAFLGKALSAHSQGRLLDVGCGQGDFLNAVRSLNLSGWELQGLEPSEEACSVARSNGLKVEQGYLGHDSLEEHSFDAITLVSVLEHLPDPKVSVDRICRLLKPDGIFFVEVPNVIHPELTMSGFFSLEHIQHFTPASLARLCAENDWNEFFVDDGASEQVIRMVASRNLVGWGLQPQKLPDADALQAADAVRRYQTEENQFLEVLRERVINVVEGWQASGKTIALYGAGAHTAALSSHINLSENCQFLIDGDPKKQGREFLGLPVCAPDQITSLGIDAILISSHRFQDEIIKTIRKLCGDEIDVATCYLGEVKV